MFYNSQEKICASVVFNKVTRRMQNISIKQLIAFCVFLLRHLLPFLQCNMTLESLVIVFILLMSYLLSATMVLIYERTSESSKAASFAQNCQGSWISFLDLGLE